MDPGKHEEASTLEELLQIRQHNRSELEGRCLGSTVGLKMKEGEFTATPAVLALVAHKMHETWISPDKVLPRFLFAPGPQGGIKCPTDVVLMRKAKPHALRVPYPTTFRNHLAWTLCGGDAFLGPGSSVASLLGETASVGPIVRARGDSVGAEREGRVGVGFLTSPSLLSRGCAGTGLGARPRGDNPGGLMVEGEDIVRLFHPQPPSRGAAVQVATLESVLGPEGVLPMPRGLALGLGGGASLADLPDSLASAFAKLAPSVLPSQVTAGLRGLEGDLGSLLHVSYKEHPKAIVGRKAAKIGRSSGLTFGRILGCAAEFYTEPPEPALRPHALGTVDFLVQPSQQGPFALKGDAGAMLVVQETRDISSTATNGDTNAFEGLSIDDSGSSCMWRPLGQLLGHGNTCGAASLARLLHEFHLDLVTSDIA